MDANANGPAASAARSVLVTGASGYVGRRLIALLAGDRRGIETLVASDLRSPPPECRLAGVVYAEGDIRDATLGALLREHRVDTVVHLAAVVTPGPGADRDLLHSIDVGGTAVVLAACLEAGARHLVVTSSGAAYGYHSDNPVELDERDPLRGNPEFAYSDHKRQVEELLARWREEHPELSQLIFRPGAILGAGTRNQITDLFDKPFLIGVRGSATPFNFIWDGDVVAAIAKGVHERRSGIFNLAGDGVLTAGEIAGLLDKPLLALPAWMFVAALSVLKPLGLTQYGPEQVDFLRFRPVLSNRRLKEEFGYVPLKTSREAFEEFRLARLCGGEGAGCNHEGDEHGGRP